MTVSLPQYTTAMTTTLPMRYNEPAKDGDWANHRDTITFLYLDQNKSLREVMRIMREEHNFSATEKMYKIRFNKWGIHKKLRAHQVAELLVQRSKRAAAGKTSVSFVHGRKIDSDRLNTYLRRVSPARRKELEAILAGRLEISGAQKRSIEDIICRTPSPEPEPESVPRRLDAPDGLRLPEECMQIVHSYVGGAFDASLWQRTPDKKLVFPRREKTWLDPVSSARQLFVNGFTDQGFHLLKITFDDYREEMSRQDPSLLVEMCLALAALLQSGPGLAESLLNYSFGLSRILFGPRHPLHLLFARLRNANASEINKFVGLVMQSYVQALLLNSQLKPTYLATLYRAMLNSDFIEVETARRRMRDVLDDLESAAAAAASPGSAGEGSALRRDVEMMRYHVSWLATLHNAPTEAAASARTLAETRGGDPRLARFACYNMLRTLRTSHAVRGDEAIDFLYRSLDICEEEFGRADNATVTLLATLQGCLRRAGHVDEADAVRRDFETRWDEVVGGAGGRGRK
ncbi:Clr5 domain-containing protein [Hypoxylon cercidicola]|nr:Clr5 domain-containing protein [Hypoxylon cercidicola]